MKRNVLGWPLTVIDYSTYGPGKQNPVYRLGNWRISRKRWSLPRTYWGWQAEAEGFKTYYGDTLEELVEQLIPEQKGQR